MIPIPLLMISLMEENLYYAVLIFSIHVMLIVYFCFEHRFKSPKQHGPISEDANSTPGRRTRKHDDLKK